jgi:RNA polymerase sigma-70 factor, ECF subfamily
MSSTRGEVTRLLGAWQEGDRGAGDRLLPMVYRRLRRMAARYMAGERSGHTLEPTALVHEAYLRLAGGSQPAWRDRRHFFAVSARLMRRVLVDHARARGAAKRGGEAVHVPLDSEPASRRPDLLADLLALDQSLLRLSEIDPRKGRIIELRYFGGLTVDEVAEVLGVSAPTVALESRMARAWLAARNRPRATAPDGAAPMTPPPRGSAA